jgi:hypothetical protein
MKNVQPGMNVPRQRRKLLALVTPDSAFAERAYVTHLVTLFDAAVAAGTPQPASSFIPMFQEEFDVV